MALSEVPPTAHTCSSLSHQPQLCFRLRVLSRFTCLIPSAHRLILHCFCIRLSPCFQLLFVTLTVENRYVGQHLRIYAQKTCPRKFIFSTPCLKSTTHHDLCRINNRGFFPLKFPQASSLSRRLVSSRELEVDPVKVWSWFPLRHRDRQQQQGSDLQRNFSSTSEAEKTALKDVLKRVNVIDPGDFLFHIFLATHIIHTRNNRRTSGAFLLLCAGCGGPLVVRFTNRLRWRWVLSLFEHFRT